MYRNTHLLGALAAGLAATAFMSSAADAGTPWIKYRQQHQLNRIGNGVSNGSLKPWETNRLLQGQTHISNLRAKARADGVVTFGERLRIQGAQSVQGFRIYRLKHN